MAHVPRELFVPPWHRRLAYADHPLPIGDGQTISQPYVVALMAQLLEIAPSDRVLEIGTGSGYAAAVLGVLAAEVHTVERIEALSARAALTLRELGLDHVHVHTADGSAGWPPAAPYDAILASAAAVEIPPALLGQLAPGGRLVLPVGEPNGNQELVRVRRGQDGHLREERLGPVSFVPLIGS
jgi:protein-L-isoaspartate(D-aspartate) O-methyltransferase